MRIKPILQITITSVALILISCNSKKDNQPTNTTLSDMEVLHQPALDGNILIDVDSSKIYWKGHKLFGHHLGTINLMKGELSFINNNISNGNFVVDMRSIRVSELMDEEEDEEDDEDPEDDKKDLAYHLMDEDFFDVKNYPTATFDLTQSTRKGEVYEILGELTIKGITNKIQFKAKYDQNQFTASIPIDRTKFGIKYGSGSFFSNLGDNIIKDHFDLQIIIKLQN